MIYMSYIYVVHVFRALPVFFFLLFFFFFFHFFFSRFECTKSKVIKDRVPIVIYLMFYLLLNI